MQILVQQAWVGRAETFPLTQGALLEEPEAQYQLWPRAKRAVGSRGWSLQAGRGSGRGHGSGSLSAPVPLASG